ncbi:unnamed protein product [marine sediment metagenome]|uniref:Uncharacterized protein n=1 Tax=marine sediment metagenome TaxID=412755 RepID=X1BG57_9ZZZZ
MSTSKKISPQSASVQSFRPALYELIEHAEEAGDDIVYPLSKDPAGFLYYDLETITDGSPSLGSSSCGYLENFSSGWR